MIPLQDLPMYSAKSYPTRYWTYSKNSTSWNIFMSSLTASGNTISRLMLQDLAPTLRGAHVGLFDSYTLFNDIMDNPRAYLNGTVPTNISGAIRACVFEENADASEPGVCTTVSGTAVDSYLWYVSVFVFRLPPSLMHSFFFKFIFTLGMTNSIHPNRRTGLSHDTLRMRFCANPTDT